MFFTDAPLMVYSTSKVPALPASTSKIFVGGTVKKKNSMFCSYVTVP